MCITVKIMMEALMKPSTLRNEFGLSRRTSAGVRNNSARGSAKGLDEQCRAVYISIGESLTRRHN